MVNLIEIILSSTILGFNLKAGMNKSLTVISMESVVLPWTLCC